MKIIQTHYVVFSPCGSTFKILRSLASGIPAPAYEWNLTLPLARERQYRFGPEDLVILGFPVYGGRLPRIAGDFFKALTGEQTPAILVASYGGRDYEDALLEMQHLAAARGFVPFSAVAAPAEHVLAARRPDDRKML